MPLLYNLLFPKHSFTRKHCSLPSNWSLDSFSFWPTSIMLPYRRVRNALSSTSMVTIISNTNTHPGLGSEATLRSSSSTSDVPRHLRPQSLPYLRASKCLSPPAHLASLPLLLTTRAIFFVEAKLLRALRRLWKWLSEFFIISGNYVGPWPEYGMINLI